MVPTDDEEKRFYDLLRAKFDGAAEQPRAETWPAVSQTLPPLPQLRRRQVPAGVAVVLSLLLGTLLGWWGGVESAEKGRFQRSNAVGDKMKVVRREMKTIGNGMKVTGGPMKASGIDMKVVGIWMKATGRQSTAAEQHMKVVGSRTKVTGTPPTATGGGTPAPGSNHPLAGGSAAGSGQSAGGGEATPVSAVPPTPSVPMGSVTVPAAPIFTIWSTALALDSAIRQEGGRNLAPTRPDSASRLAGLVAVQRATLGLLQHRLDSLKAALPAEPPLLAISDTSTKPTADTTRPNRSPWALSLLVETTKSWALPPTAETATTRETLPNTLTRGVRLERALTDRWTLRLGLGETRVRGQFNYDGIRTGERLKTDTSAVTVTTAFEKRDTTFIIQQYQTPQLNPVINGAGQIIGYDTLFLTRYDTSYQIVISHDTVRRTETRVTTRTETWRERQQQQLRPEYRFWTLPLSAQYDVLRWRRWRAGLSAGVQVVVFRGGWQPTWRGDQYELRRIGPRDGPFRPVSLALTAGLEVRYQLTERLGLLGGGTVRGWGVNPAKGVSKTQLTPGALLGISWGFGK